MVGSLPCVRHIRTVSPMKIAPGAQHREPNEDLTGILWSV